MPRPSGARNADFETARLKIAERIVFAVAAEPRLSSFADLAASAGVSRATVRHYFPSRDALIGALFDHMATLGREAAAAHPVDVALELPRALVLGLEQLVAGWRLGVGSLFVAGLIWGFRDDNLGPAYLHAMLEPMLLNFETMLRNRVPKSQMSDSAVREASLILVSPVVMALIHQEDLSGARCRPLDLHSFIENHVRQFVAGWLT